MPVADVQVTNNTLWANDNGCGVVVSAFNTGITVSDVLVSQNTIIGTGFNAAGPDVGGIVAQSNGAFSTVRDITISRNTITNSAEAGVIVHAAAPGSKTKNITVSQNTLSGNNWMGDGPDQTAGVVVAVVGPPAGADLGGGFTNPGEWNESTFVSQNTMTDQLLRRVGLRTEPADALPQQHQRDPWRLRLLRGLSSTSQCHRKYPALTLLCGLGGLRFGEAIALRRWRSGNREHAVLT